MVSFSCEQCCEVMKKPKLDAHAQRCWGAQFTCIDCNTTFEGTAYRAHTSCVSEEQRYHKSVYKAPKGKGKNQQQQQQQQQSKQQAAPAAPAPAPAAVESEPSSSNTTTPPAPASSSASNKRAREEEEPTADAEQRNGDVATAVTNGGGEPDKKKKKKKDKKQKNKDKKEEEEKATTSESEPAASLSAFLTSIVEPLLLQKKTPETEVSLAEVRRTVLEAAREKGYEAAQVEERLWQGLKVGGKKGKVRIEFSKDE